MRRSRSSSWSAVTNWIWCWMSSGAISLPRHASTFSWSVLEAGERRCSWPGSPRSCAATGTSPGRCCPFDSWKRAWRSSASPTSGWRPCSISPTKSMRTMPRWRENCATPGPRWRRAGASRSSRRRPAPPHSTRRIGWAGDSSSSSRTCSHSAAMPTMNSAGNSAKCCRRSLRSSFSLPPPAASASWTKWTSPSSRCSASSVWSRWIPRTAVACGRS